MIAQNLFDHLKELGVIVALNEDFTGLAFDAPKGVLTPELMALVREHKAELIAVASDAEESEPAQAKVERQRPYILRFEGDKKLIEDYRHHPRVAELVDALCRHGGGVVEFLRDDRRAA
ncbi:MAG: hypothetical protein H0W99_07365 [Acidobacteria bacterium]|nr:hypothetical protein [Acidobacteriota bacterium]